MFVFILFVICCGAMFQVCLVYASAKQRAGFFPGLGCVLGKNWMPFFGLGLKRNRIKLAVPWTFGETINVFFLKTSTLRQSLCWV